MIKYGEQGANWVSEGKFLEKAEFSVKSRKHSTRTLSLVQNRVRFKENLQESKLALGRRGSGVKLRNAPFFLCQTEFHPVLTPCFLFPERLHSCYIYFHCSYMYNYYSQLEPCALNAEFQHFIPRFNKTSLLCGTHSKRGQGVKRGPKTG